MGFIDNNFTYSEDKNEFAEKFKFLNLNYDGEIIDEGKILTYHQLEGMFFPKNVGEVKLPFVSDERHYNFIRVVYKDEKDRKEGIEKARKLARRILIELDREQEKREELTRLFLYFRNKVSTRNTEGLSLWLPKYEPKMGDYLKDLEFYKKFLKKIYIYEGDVYLPSALHKIMKRIAKNKSLEDIKLTKREVEMLQDSVDLDELKKII